MVRVTLSILSNRGREVSKVDVRVPVSVGVARGLPSVGSGGGGGLGQRERLGEQRALG